MSRPIKVRAWDTTVGRFLDGWELTQYVQISRDGCIEYVDSTPPFNNRAETTILLSEFTGLLDCNGKAVYEGDIYWNLDNGLIGKFSYLNGPGGYTLHTRENNSDGSPYNMLPFAELDTTNFEVIGNIYETPKLIERKERV